MADLAVFAQNRQIKFPPNLKIIVMRQIKFPPNLKIIVIRQIKFPPKKNIFVIRQIKFPPNLKTYAICQTTLLKCFDVKGNLCFYYLFRPELI